jgi:hypothetical protein
LEVMTAILKAGAERRWVELTTTCTRPAPLGVDEAKELQRAADLSTIA